MTKVKNVSLAGEQLVTQYGTYVFDATGIVEVPDELAQKLVTINGFTIVGKVEDDTIPSGDVTLDGGVVWHKIEGGYIVSNDVITFTVTGSGVDSNVIPPENVTLQNGMLLFNDTTDVNNVHVKGVIEGDTIQIGESVYKWWDVDGNMENGYELKIVPHTESLPGGGSYYTVPGGYVVTDEIGAFTLTGDSFDSDRIGVVNGQLIIQDGVDTTNLHVIGVTPDDTIQIGTSVYQWKNLDNISSNGYELSLVSKDGWHTISGGYVYDKDNVTYTISGSAFSSNDFVPNNIVISDGTISLNSNIDITNVHVKGVNENDTIQIGNNTYQWLDTDNNPENGYELKIIVTPQSLPGGGTYLPIEGGYVLEGDGSTFTVLGDHLDTEHISIQNGELVITDGADIDNLVVIGVPENDTIQIGDDTYKWVLATTNPDDGMKLELIPHTESLPGGGSYYTVPGGYVVTDEIGAFTLTGDSFDSDRIGVVDGQLIIQDGVDTTNLHVIGVTPDDTIQIGTSTYQWENLDNISSNGYELSLVSKDGWHTISGGYVYDKDNVTYTISGSAFSSNDIMPNNVTINDGVISLSSDIDVTNVHVTGVIPGSTIQIGNATYKWDDTNTAIDGYELIFVPEVHSLPDGGTYTAIENGYVLEGDGSTFTVLGDHLDTEHISIQNGELVITDGADIDNLVVKGVTENDTIQIGDDTYKWVLVTTNPDDGMKLELIPHTESLPGGGSYYTVPGGYVVTDEIGSFTLTGDSFDMTQIGVSNGQLIIRDGINTTNLHVIGVTPDDTIQIGTSVYQWKNLDNISSNGYELSLVSKDGWHTISGGYVYDKDDVTYTISGSAFSSNDFVPNNIVISDGTISLNSNIDITNVHVKGVNENDTIQIGNNTYQWLDTDNNPENGYELKYIQQPIELSNGGSYVTLEGGFAITDGKETFTLVGNTIDADHIGIKNGTLEILPGANLNDIHIIGVTENDTIQIGKDTYRWADVDANPNNGYELKLVPNTGWKVDNKNIIYDDGITSYTITGPDFTFDVDANAPVGVTVEGGSLKFSSEINPLNIHVIGVEENSVIQIDETYYKWINADGDVSNGLELTPLDVPEGFEYDFDGKKFTVEGGIGSEITLEQLNQGVKFDENGKLIIGKDIVSSIGNVHIQGLESGATINVAGEDYTLMDTDNDLENGYELVGGTDDAFDWRWSNRSRPAEPQIWRHYDGNNADIKVQGVSARPTYNERAHTVTLIGTEISSVTNSTSNDLKLAGDVTGVLSSDSVFSLKNGIVGSANEAYVYLDGVLYVPNGSITKLRGNLEFTLVDKKLTITSGNLDVDEAIVSGTAIAAVTINNKNFLVSGNKLIRNAFSKRRTIRVS